MSFDPVSYLMGTKASGGGGGGDQQIHYTVSWNGDEAGRDSVADWAYKISDFAPALEDVKVDGFVLSISVGGSTVTVNVLASREKEGETGYLMGVIQGTSSAMAGVVYDLDTERRGIYLVSFDRMAQILGARPDSITLTWQRTGQLTAADTEAKIASVSPLTLDVSWEPGNWVETIEGTLANLLQTSDHTISELAAEINGGNATVLLDIDGSQAGLPGAFKFSLLPSVGGASNYIGGSLNAIGNSISDTLAVGVDFETPNSLYYFHILRGGTISDLASAGDQFPTTLTIIHHPLPSGN